MIGHLIAELSRDLTTLCQIGAEIREAMLSVRGQSGNQMFVDALAVRLHRLYGCVDDMAYRALARVRLFARLKEAAHRTRVEQN